MNLSRDVMTLIKYQFLKFKGTTMNAPIQSKNNLIEVIDSAEKYFLSRSNNDRKTWIRESAFALQIMQDTYSRASIALLNAARSNPESFAIALGQLCEAGLTLNRSYNYAYLIPMNNSVKLEISYRGLLFLAQKHGQIKYAIADVVYDGDNFEYLGKLEKPVHTFNPFNTERTAVIGAYCSALLPDGNWMTEVMDRKEILKIRNCSFSKSKDVWDTWSNEMIKKSVVKRAHKFWPCAQKDLDSVYSVIDNDDYSDNLQQVTQSNADVINNLLT